MAKKCLKIAFVKYREVIPFWKEVAIRCLVVLLTAVISNSLFSLLIGSVEPQLPVHWNGEFRFKPIAGPKSWCEPFNRSLDYWKTINFIETTGEECLRIRQACAIESAARANPDLQVVVHRSSKPSPGTPERDEGFGLRRDCSVRQILDHYSNIRYVTEELSDHLKGTPLWMLYASGDMNSSTYSNQHLSDAVRVAMLYNNGGIYLDTDVIIFRPLHCLHNSAGFTEMHPTGTFKQQDFNIETGLLAYDKGHSFLWYLMKQMTIAYEPEQRSSIGPTTVTENFKNFCRRQTRQELSVKHYRCVDGSAASLLGPELFYPIEYAVRHRFYTPEFPEHELQFLRHSFGVHAYESQHGRQADETSLFFYLATNYCPLVLNYSMQQWREF